MLPPLTKSTIALFTVSFLGAFLMVFLPKLGMKASFISSSAKFTGIEKIKPKLNRFPNNYILKIKNNGKKVGGFNNASAYGVADFDSGEVLAEKNLNKKLPIASLTKLMTAVVALDLADPAEKFTVSGKAQVSEPTRMGLLKGQQLSVESLLNGLLLTSANDAAEVLMEGIDEKYGGQVFIPAMNEKTRLLGLKNTHFDNPQGLDSPGNYSSAGDLIILSHYALTNYPLIAGIVKKDYQYIPYSTDKWFDLYNWNGLIGVYPGASGVKIGNTDLAGFTAVATSQRENMRIVAVELGAPTTLKRDLWAAELLDNGFESLGIPPAAITENLLKQKYSTWKYWH